VWILSGIKFYNYIKYNYIKYNLGNGSNVIMLAIALDTTAKLLTTYKLRTGYVSPLTDSFSSYAAALDHRARFRITGDSVVNITLVLRRCDFSSTK